MFLNQDLNFQKLIKNSCAIHKGNHSREGVFVCDKTHIEFDKTFASRSIQFLPRIDAISTRFDITVCQHGKCFVFLK